MINPSKVIHVLILSFVLAGCSGIQPSVTVTTGDILLQEDFADENGSSFPSYAIGEDIIFGVVDGVYTAIVTGGGYVWTLNNQTHDDVIIEVTMNKVSSNTEDSYGIICRAHSTNNGMGYYFLLDGAGRFGIRKGDGERIHVLVPWTESNAIRTGQAENTLRAVCVDDYLALTINGTFVAETRDRQYVEGLLGVVLTTTQERVAITYDNLTIREASISNP